MHVAFTTTFDAREVRHWSGTPYYMANAFRDAGMEVTYIGNLPRKLPPFFKPKQLLKKWLGKRESPRFNQFAAKHYSSQVAKQLLNHPSDVVISPLINPIVYLETNKPIVLWTDALYAALLGFYSQFSAHSAATIAQGNELTKACLSRVQLAIFSSQWAANSALELYGAAKEKVKVVPFGANISVSPTFEEIQQMIQNRPKNKIRLLFLAKSWERKGGDIVLQVTDTLHKQGYPIELHIVGFTPPIDPIPSYVHCHGFISKNTEQGQRTIRQLLADTHFLFVPSRAEAYGIVFCEANAFGLPCLTTYVGGISTIVRDDINGKTFSISAPVSAYCDYIVNLFNHPARYQDLALSSYHEYTQRLNWQSSVKEVKRLLHTII